MPHTQSRQQDQSAFAKVRGAGVPAFRAGFFFRFARAVHGIEICPREPLNTTPAFGEAL